MTKLRQAPKAASAKQGVNVKAASVKAQTRAALRTKRWLQLHQYCRRQGHPLVARVSRNNETKPKIILQRMQNDATRNNCQLMEKYGFCPRGILCKYSHSRSVPVLDGGGSHCGDSHCGDSHCGDSHGGDSHGDSHCGQECKISRVEVARFRIFNHSTGSLDAEVRNLKQAIWRKKRVHALNVSDETKAHRRRYLQAQIRDALAGIALIKLQRARACTNLSFVLERRDGRYYDMYFAKRVGSEWRRVISHMCVTTTVMEIAGWNRVCFAIQHADDIPVFRVVVKKWKSSKCHPKRVAFKLGTPRAPPAHANPFLSRIPIE